MKRNVIYACCICCMKERVNIGKNFLYISSLCHGEHDKLSQDQCKPRLLWKNFIKMPGAFMNYILLIQIEEEALIEITFRRRTRFM